MKKLLFLLPIGLFLASCANDFEVTAPWKDIPVVYGILAPLELDTANYPGDTAYYIRVEKAFLDPERSALEIAQIADSLYYPESAITVWLQEVPTGTPQKLHRVDGALEGYPRNGGIFAGQPNWLYKLKPSGGFSVEGEKTYRLIIERTDGKPDVTAETTVPKDFTLASPNIGERLYFESGKSQTFKWNSDANAAFFNLTLVFEVQERTGVGTLVNTNTLFWEAAKNIERDSTVHLSGTSFYIFLAKALQRPPAGHYRTFANKYTIIIDGGGKEIKEYLETYLANSGLTGAETFPNYTNISEGYGIFTAKNRSVFVGPGIHEQTIIEMMNNSITDTLGFDQ